MADHAFSSDAFSTDAYSSDAYDIDGASQSSSAGRVRPEPRVKYRSTDWGALCARVDPSVRNKKEITYDVGSGTARRLFTETKPYD